MDFGILLCLGLFWRVVNATLNPIVIKGNAFFDSVTNDRFYIRGVDYQVLTRTAPQRATRECWLIWQPGGSSAVNYDPLAYILGLRAGN